MIHFSSSRFVWTLPSHHINNEAMEKKKKERKNNQTKHNLKTKNMML